MWTTVSVYGIRDLLVQEHASLETCTTGVLRLSVQDVSVVVVLPSECTQESVGPSMHLIRPYNYFLFNTLLVITLLTLTNCVTNERGRSITVEEIAWIQKGITTRTEIVKKFGTPYSEVPDGTTVTTTVLPTTTNEDGSKTTIVTSKLGLAKNTKATYLHTKTEGGLFRDMKVTQEQFTVRYDERGMVQDFGLERLH